MICYKDRTFCSRGADCTCQEWRKLTPEVWEVARKWWGNGDAPVSYADLCDGKREEGKGERG